MSKIIKSLRTVNETKKTVQAGTKQIIITTHELNTSYAIYLGGPGDIYCIDIQVLKDIELNRRYFDIDTANLNNIYYDRECSIDKNFRRGTDTTMILRLAMAYIHENYPYVNKLRFKDASSKECDNGHVVELYNMSYLTTGQTWYEKNFNAYIEKEADRRKIESDKRKFQEKKQVLPWEVISQFIRTSYPIEETEMETIYNNTNTWQDFFGRLRNKIGIAEFCNFISPWMRNFVQQIMSFDLSSPQYIIPIEGQQIPYSEIRGGKRRIYTRKQKKRFPRNYAE